MKRVKYTAAIESFVGTLDSKKDGQANRQRVVSRYRPGTEGFQMYSMKMHDGPWAEGATANRELIKSVQREAHAIERAAKHPELSTAEYTTLAAEWQKRFEEYKATKKPGDQQYATLYTYTYSHLYRESKAGEVLDILKAKSAAKRKLYQSLLPQIQSLIAAEPDFIANMANIVAVLHNTFHFLWTGFYRVGGEQLILAPFQGPVACTRIPYNKGVCGKAWAQAQTLIVPNVHEFPGHIACSSASKSEIVVPVRRGNAPDGEIIAVLDIDSADYNTFDAIDRQYLEQICGLLGATVL